MPGNCQLQFSGHHLYFRNSFHMLVAVYNAKYRYFVVHLSHSTTPFQTNYIWKNRKKLTLKHNRLHPVVYAFKEFRNLTAWPARGLKVLFYFSCPIQLSMKFQMIIKTKMLKIDISLALEPSDVVFIYPAHKCKNANNCWHSNIYERDKSHAQLSWAWKKLYNL